VDSAGDELVGRTLRDGRYVVTGILGEGSQGCTLDAVDKREGRAVAIKRFQVRGARSWKDVELAEREAQVLSQLSHALLPCALEHFEEEGALYLVMEKIEGTTVAALGMVDAAEVVRFLEDAGEVLDYLHDRAPPVVHRDIKPRNILRRPARADERHSRYVLVDFGSVRQRLDTRGGSTVAGTFGYMAPEQFQGRALPQSDVYAVGVTALAMLTGSEPEDLPHRGLGIDVERALGGRHPELAKVLAPMVEPDPDRRARRIGPLLSGLSAVSEPPAKEPPAARAGATRRRSRRAERQARRAAKSQHRAEVRAEALSQLPPIIRSLMRLGLALASLAVWAALDVVVPIVLTMLSLLFGGALLRAAANVRRAGRRARAAMALARRHVSEAARSASPSPSRPTEPRGSEALRKERFEAEIEGAVRELEDAVDEAVAREVQAVREAEADEETTQKRVKRR
jgi:hypothetical protein